MLELRSEVKQSNSKGSMHIASLWFSEIIAETMKPHNDTNSMGAL